MTFCRLAIKLRSFSEMSGGLTLSRVYFLEGLAGHKGSTAPIGETVLDPSDEEVEQRAENPDQHHRTQCQIGM